ncbi:hypothetical protein Barb6_01776 [Bacteroidales bacterium Barb6]|nr:hypothetical protein Barb6_01776 [Bacteroidales bacterium Barb6]
MAEILIVLQRRKKSCASAIDCLISISSPQTSLPTSPHSGYRPPQTKPPCVVHLEIKYPSRLAKCNAPPSDGTGNAGVAPPFFSNTAFSFA